MKTILLYIFLCLASIAACGLLGNDEPDIPGKIVFSADDGYGTSQIFTMNADGTNLKQLTFWDRSSVDPAWSPDGRRIVFATGYQATTLGPSLYIMDADGDNKRPLKKLPYESPNALYGSEPAWSPDGKRIAYQFCTNCEAFGSNYEIAIAEVEGEEYDSTQIHTITSYSGSDRYPVWSPDGSRIAFNSDRNNPNESGSDLYLMNFNGSNTIRHTTDIYVGSKSWHPNANKIVLAGFKKNSTVNLYEYIIESETLSKLKININKTRPIAWSKNGKYLLLSKAENHNRDALYFFNVETNNLKQISTKARQFSGVDWHTQIN